MSNELNWKEIGRNYYDAAKDFFTGIVEKAYPNLDEHCEDFRFGKEDEIKDIVTEEGNCAIKAEILRMVIEDYIEKRFGEEYEDDDKNEFE